MEHLYIVCYDIRNQKRWRKLFKTMKGCGEWLQLSVFQCRLNKMRLLEMEDQIREIVNQAEDHVVIMDLGPADRVKLSVRSIGQVFEPIERKSVIV